MAKTLLAVVVMTLFLWPQAAKANLRYNFVIFLTDDQRWDTLWAMPVVRTRLASRGVTFQNAFTTTPVCCPSRASLLTGQYAHHHKVLNNAVGMWGLNQFDTLATNLQRAGWRTGFTGKYMHGYSPGYIPPGWTMFVAGENGGQLLDWRRLRNITTGSSLPGAARLGATYDVDRYLTLHHQDVALDFLDRYGQRPFFLFISTYAPHTPATPQQGDMGLFADYIYRGRGYGEADLSDKPAWLRAAAIDALKPSDELNRNRLRSLQSVDRMVGVILDRLAALGVQDRTVVIFASDNGVSWGEHRFYDKGAPYEEVIRVPLIVSVPGPAPATPESGRSAARRGARVESKMALLIDIAPTIYELAGLVHPADGRSLIPLLADPQAAYPFGRPFGHSQASSEASWREDFIIEAFGYLEWGFETDGIWQGVRSERWKYVRWNDGEVELYDLQNDPFELENIAPARPDEVRRQEGRRLDLLGRMLYLPVVSNDPN
jgi:arylsulfatase A-like enzyme